MIEQLLPASVSVVEAFGDVPGEDPFPGEERLIARAVEGRRREFVTARRCAREALLGLGFPPAPIGAGPRREPLWPAGVAGAITHCTGYRGAAVTRIGDLAGVGIDAEPDAPLPDGVGVAVTTPGERSMLAALTAADPTVHWGRLLFSAKESVFKAWYPLTGRMLDFAEAALTIDPVSRTFRARVLVDGRRADGGPPLSGFDGRFLAARGLLLTAVTVP
ncbi:4'-phosphopantetheinyl transferase superfamily protein [Dactylosporangium sp. NPDC005555]|uniref:4'-phosphopantetheinyl transferase family protein n=1 Tax=Dactylosporangium sp. NPDC005555 TaxID=3154889 RepID=UPI0033A79289